MEGNGLYSKRSGRVPQRVIYALLFTLVVVVIVLLFPKNLSPSDRYNSGIMIRQQGSLLVDADYYSYNSTYPFSLPISKPRQQLCNLL